MGYKPHSSLTLECIMRGSEFAALRAFVAVVDHNNFARAAGQSAYLGIVR